MPSKSRLAEVIALSLLGSAVLSTSAVAAEDAAANNDKQTYERIEVTGSRIARENAYAPTPVTMVTGEELLGSGVTNIGEALNQLPALGSTMSLASSGGSSIGTAGLNLLDLRNLGTSRTLVLVNGKRHVSSQKGTSAVDVNTIPSAWIERVEIITGGASAIYGADAVTGVVNFILKKNITGLDINASIGTADDSDFRKKRFSISYGQDIDGGRGNVAFAAEYSGQNALGAMDRDATKTSYANMANNAEGRVDDNDPSNPDMIRTPNSGYYTMGNDGRFQLSDSDYWKRFNRDGSFSRVDLGSNQYSNFCTDCDSINIKQFNELQPKFDRYNLNFKTNYDITTEDSVYFEAKYSRTEASNSGQPAYFFGNPKNTVSIDNAFVTPELRDLMQSQNVDSFVVNRFMTDAGVRIEDDTRETQRYVLGVKGLIGEDWDYDIYAVYGQTDLERTNKNNLIYQNYQYALDSVRDADGNAVCRSATARAEGCTPINIFGFGAPSRAAIDYINVDLTGTSTIKQTVLSGSVANSSLFELPAGFVGFSAGVEYRKEQSETKEPDYDKKTFFNALGNDVGSFNVKEVFAELSVPLLSDLPLIRQLDLDLAGRYADYSTIGDATTWKAGLSWEINDELRMRSTYARAIRAPNISELYGAASQDFFQVKDSCRLDRLNELDNSSTRAANCAALGVPADFNSAYDSSTLEGVSSGNRDLNPEKSKSFTLGLVYQPSFIDNLALTVDYWDITIDDAISSIDAQDILDKCLDSETGINNQYCALISRNPDNHQINNIVVQSMNLAKLEASGVDFDVRYSFDLLGGELTSGLIATKLIRNRQYSFQNDPSSYEDFAGTAGLPDWQSNLSLKYDRDNWEATWRTRYMQKVDLYSAQSLARNANPSNVMDYGTYVISEMAIGYKFDNGLGLKFGVDNVFDKSLPFGTIGTSASSAMYDNVGRYFYTSASFSF
ncbi:TonB-dependent receptor [Shewanella sp. C32]|uniref:TonB-dependent receptor n=1 Tax=Shewanella electrica TaxID=515560 RepID=A0ABT2FH82_9GAMM|nr:TonB-dependent receptor [Shewanella electrica]MCH1923584.1 TonB-dependent receptor [Shewanella electrica]MCS4555680.1 TonB-dependent receptor [Shewanella electrica]